MLDKIEKLMDNYICDNCLGRQFAQLLSGYSNKERGKILRDFAALATDAGLIKPKEMSNFYGYRFRNIKDIKIKKPGKCQVCNGFFDKIDRYADKIVKKLSGYEFNTFLIGTKVSKDLIRREEEIWEKIGIEFCEPIRAEINRELGKIIEKKIKKKVDLLKPDIAVLFDMEKNKIILNIRSLYIFGYYQKIKAGIPQSKWGTPGKYKTSIEEEIGRYLLKLTKAKDHKFHGAGREDIDAKCTAWRPFVIEAIAPIKRKINLKELAELVNSKSKYVRIKGLKIVDFSVVEKIKSAKPDKTYKVIVSLKKEIDKKKLKDIKKLIGEIRQRTPTRVVHRRADIVRKRKVKDIKYKVLGKKKLELVIKAEAGTYIKELISGDNSRTKPSLSDILGQEAKCENLEVVKIEKIDIQ